MFVKLGSADKIRDKILSTSIDEKIKSILKQQKEDLYHLCGFCEILRG